MLKTIKQKTTRSQSYITKLNLAKYLLFFNRHKAFKTLKFCEFQKIPNNILLSIKRKNFGNILYISRGIECVCVCVCVCVTVFVCVWVCLCLCVCVCVCV